MNTFARLIVIVPAFFMMAFLATFTLGWAPPDWKSVTVSLLLFSWPLALIVWIVADQRKRRRVNDKFKVGTHAQD